MHGALADVSPTIQLSVCWCKKRPSHVKTNHVLHNGGDTVILSRCAQLHGSTSTSIAQAEAHVLFSLHSVAQDDFVATISAVLMPPSNMLFSLHLLCSSDITSYCSRNILTHCHLYSSNIRVLVAVLGQQLWCLHQGHATAAEQHRPDPPGGGPQASGVHQPEPEQAVRQHGARLESLHP